MTGLPRGAKFEWDHFCCMLNFVSYSCIPLIKSDVFHGAPFTSCLLVHLFLVYGFYRRSGGLRVAVGVQLVEPELMGSG